jgi:putative ABC transport system ATP-binding protein
MIEVENLQLNAGGRTVLRLAAWSTPPGRHTLVLGPSGSGKTTLLHALAGLRRPTAGRILIAGQDLARLGAAALDRFRGQTIGYVFQNLRLIQSLSVRDNLRLAQSLAGQTPDPTHIDDLLERLHISHLANRLPRQASQGESQRAAVARALAARPRLVFADEPTSALDDSAAQRVAGLLRAEADACGATLVIATHDQRLKDLFPDRLELAAPEAAP